MKCTSSTIFTLRFIADAVSPQTSVSVVVHPADVVSPASARSYQGDQCRHRRAPGCGDRHRSVAPRGSATRGSERRGHCCDAGCLRRKRADPCPHCSCLESGRVRRGGVANERRQARAARAKITCNPVGTPLESRCRKWRTPRSRCQRRRPH